MEQDVSANTKCIGVAESSVALAEGELQQTQAAKRIAYLESKTEDLENQGRRNNLRLDGLQEEAKGYKTLFNFDKVHCTFCTGQTEPEPEPTSRCPLSDVPREGICLS